MHKRILVLGATGMLGKSAARSLHEDGFQVRILARDVAKARALFPEPYEVVPGNVTDLASLEQAMVDCTGVHISVGGPVDQISAENVTKLAPKLGIEQITYISGSTVKEENKWFPMTAQKLLAETAVCECGIPYTIFCPTWPFEQLPRFVVNGQATLIGDKPTAWRWFAADDLGHMVANAYQREDALNKRLYVHGPESITMNEALERYCQVFYPEIESVMMMPITMAQSVADSTNNQMLKFFTELMSYFQTVGEPGDPTEANDILGAPTTTLVDWLAQQEQMMEFEK